MNIASMSHTTNTQLITDLANSAHRTTRCLEGVQAYGPASDIYARFTTLRIHELMRHRPHNPEY